MQCFIPRYHRKDLSGTMRMCDWKSPFLANISLILKIFGVKIKSLSAYADYIQSLTRLYTVFETIKVEKLIQK